MKYSNTNVPNSGPTNAGTTHIAANYPVRAIVKTIIKPAHGLKAYKVAMGNRFELYLDMERKSLEMDD